MQIPFVLTFTKADKQNQRETSKNVKAFLEDMKTSWEFLPQHFVTSAKTGMGKDPLVEYLESVMEELPPVE
jgi:GTP-binding protein